MSDQSGPASERVRPLTRVRQIREFDELAVAPSELDAIADVARWSGSSANSQPWRFVVLRDRATIKRIADAVAPQARALQTAPAAIAIVLPDETPRPASRATRFPTPSTRAGPPNGSSSPRRPWGWGPGSGGSWPTSAMPFVPSSAFPGTGSSGPSSPSAIRAKPPNGPRALRARPGCLGTRSCSKSAGPRTEGRDGGPAAACNSPTRPPWKPYPPADARGPLWPPARRGSGPGGASPSAPAR